MPSNAPTPPFEDRLIAENEAAIVNWLLRHGSPGKRLLHLAPDVAALRVVWKCDCGCPSVDFEKYDADKGCHPLAEACGKTPSGSVGLILWGRDDAISGLEVYSMEETSYCTLPATDNLLPWPTA